MNTLVVYDYSGYIITQMSGSVREPIGLPFLWLDISETQVVVSVDTTVTPNVPILIDKPISESTKMQSDIDALYTGLNMLMTEIIPALMST